MFGKKNTYQTEDAAVVRAQKAVCREDMELTRNGTTRRRPFSFEPSDDEGASGRSVQIGKQSVIIALLVAPRRCGKTTLLSTMYREFKQVMGDDFCMEPFRMMADQKEKLELNRQSLNDFTNAPGHNTGLAPSDSLEEYEFVIYSKKHPRLSFLLRFIDVPGEWVNTHQEAMRILIGGADILYITINSPALMEENGAYNEDFNASSAILQLTDALSDNRISKRSRMLLFVPVKCEKYYWDMIRGTNVEALSGLNQRIQECYRALIESVQTNQRLQNSTTMAITPIMTVGGAKFCQFMPDEENAHKDTYIRILGYITDKNGYRPTFCEQPLLYTLSFIHSRIQSQVKKSGLIGFFADAGALGLPTAFRFAFHDPLCDAIQRKTECADFGRFKTVEDYQKTESADAGRAEMQYPEGIYGDVDILGYSILANPQRIVDVSP